MTFGPLSFQADLNTPTKNFSNTDAEYLVAPLWFRNISQELLNITVSWEIQEEGANDTDILEFAGRAVDDYSLFEYGEDAEFSPVWSMAVTWNVSLFPPRDVYETVCREYSKCVCQEYDYRENYDDTNSGYGNEDNTSCPIDECYANNSWSGHDTDYLSLLCRTYYFYYQPPVQITPAFSLSFCYFPFHIPLGPVSVDTCH